MRRFTERTIAIYIAGIGLWCVILYALGRKGGLTNRPFSIFRVLGNGYEAK